MVTKYCEFGPICVKFIHLYRADGWDPEEVRLAMQRSLAAPASQRRGNVSSDDDTDDEDLANSVCRFQEWAATREREREQRRRARQASTRQYIHSY